MTPSPVLNGQLLTAGQRRHVESRKQITQLICHHQAPYIGEQRMRLLNHYGQRASIKGRVRYGLVAALPNFLIFPKFCRRAEWGPRARAQGAPGGSGSGAQAHGQAGSAAKRRRRSAGYERADGERAGRARRAARRRPPRGSSSRLPPSIRIAAWSRVAGLPSGCRDHAWPSAIGRSRPRAR